MSVCWVVVELLVGARGTWLSPVAALSFLHNYLPEPDVVPFLQQSWSLAVEEHSYLLLALISLLVLRDPRRAAAVALLLAILAIANGVRLSGTHDPSVDQSIFWRTDVRIASVLIAFATCLILRPLVQKARTRWIAWVAPSCMAGAIWLGLAGGSDATAMIACTILASLAVNTAELSAAPLRRLLEHPALIWVGIISFSLYLWQQPFFLASRAGVPILPCVVGTFACALWTFRRIEWPARQYLNGRWDRVPTAPMGASPTPATAN
jgi:peptidoglycan/LPS O-acetylase OafA/YrhL